MLKITDKGMQQIVEQKNSIEPVSRAGKDFLRFNFDGLLTQKKAIELCTEWKKYSLQEPEKSFVIVFNASKMENYEPQARIAFQKCMKEMSKQIDKIWVVTDSKLVLGGASIMSLIVGLPIRAVRSEEQIIV
ncbi:hypothetical protein SanaruYs_37030 [Chryseotalea sanaruensis]|uniref:STAS/SEC14 domain-containing protein n=1 Tax=Chryseotalea sanaruensis TaxID=2482724 RepID=A0A401UEX3_9BACT|nr:STAS/SEC14 domain-containing protein [Chryseotalea sanaruensis]GCC53459.1 hypothetical protein SanaruYs_37030 [Chryseotalea sanaruensis]